VSPDTPGRFSALPDRLLSVVLAQGFGPAAVSPVWFQFRDNAFEVVIGEDDVKLRHLAARPRCELVVFEAVPPFRRSAVSGWVRTSRR
jgi:hypothetical protein